MKKDLPLTLTQFQQGLAKALEKQRTEILGDVDVKLDAFHSRLMIDVRTVLRAELQDIRERLDRLFTMESGDIAGQHEELIALKRRVVALEKKLA